MSDNLELQKYFNSLIEEYKELGVVINYLRKRLKTPDFNVETKKPKVSLSKMIFETLERKQIPMSTYEIWHYINVHFDQNVKRANVCSNLCNRRKIFGDIKITPNSNWYPAEWDNKNVEPTP